MKNRVVMTTDRLNTCNLSSTCAVVWLENRIGMTISSAYFEIENWLGATGFWSVRRFSMVGDRWGRGPGTIIFLVASVWERVDQVGTSLHDFFSDLGIIRRGFVLRVNQRVINSHVLFFPNTLSRFLLFLDIFKAGRP